MEKKYKLTEETINIEGKTLYRIEALKDFADIKKGDKGGFVEKEMTVGFMTMRRYMVTHGSVAMQQSMTMP